MPSTLKEPSHAKDEYLGAGMDIGDNVKMQQSRCLTAIIEREGDGYGLGKLRALSGKGASTP